MRLIIVFFMCFSCLFACRQKSKNEFAALLAQPPFDVYTDSIQRTPSRADLYVSRGGLLAQNQQFDAALADFGKAWQLQPDAAHAYYYGSMLINVQRYDSAINHLSEAAQKFPNSLDLKERLGYAYEQKKAYPQALQVYDELLKLDSSAFRTWAAKAYVLQETAGDSAALPAFEKSFVIQPISSIGEEIAFIYASQKKAQTLAFCDLLIKQDTARISVKPYYCKGLYYKNTGNRAEAEKLFDYCMKEDYTFADAYMEKGQLLFEDKKYEEALRIFTLAKTNSPMYADAYYWAGKSMEALGRTGPAAIEYERAFVLDKDFTEAKAAMERLKVK
jgi:tetratricopeptide (TPR) repeat protein